MTLVSRVVRASAAVLLATLLTVGLATGGLLWWEARRSLDRELLVAATSYGERDWEPEDVRSHVRVRLAEADDPRLASLEEDHDEPVWLDERGHRVLLLPVETDDDGGEHHHVIVASAHAVGPGVVAPFAVSYAAVGLLAAGAGTLLLRRLLGDAVAPLQRARDDVGAILGAGRGARVDAQGPEEVQDLLAAVNGLLERLDAAFAAQARFTAEAAHELRTPVAAMLGELDVALRRPRTAEELEQVLRQARGDVVRLGDLVDGLLLLARVDAGQAEQAREAVRGSALATAAVRHERRTVEAAGGAVTIEVERDGEAVVQEPLVVAALGNLVRNAAIHAPGSPVVVRVRNEGRLRFEVDDRGPGVPADAREAAFDRLARGARARKTAGLGLGLPLAREIARRHGGDVWLEDAPGGGCRAVLEVGGHGGPPHASGGHGGPPHGSAG